MKKNIKSKKDYNEEKEKSQILWMIFIVPILVFILDLANLGYFFFPYLTNLTDKYDWLSFIGTYSGTIVSAIFLLFITKMDRRDNNEILRKSQRPYLDVNWTILKSDFVKSNKTNINRQLFFYNIYGADEYNDLKEYLTLEIQNTGSSTAILNVNNSEFTLEYSIYVGIFDGVEKYEKNLVNTKLDSIVKRKSIAAGESMFIVINSILLYDTNWNVDNNVSIKNTKIYYKDLFNCEYKDICKFENEKIVPENDNEIIVSEKSEK